MKKFSLVVDLETDRGYGRKHKVPADPPEHIATIEWMIKVPKAAKLNASDAADIAKGFLRSLFREVGFPGAGI